MKENIIFSKKKKKHKKTSRCSDCDVIGWDLKGTARHHLGILYVIFADCHEMWPTKTLNITLFIGSSIILQALKLNNS